MGYSNFSFETIFASYLTTGLSVKTNRMVTGYDSLHPMEGKKKRKKLTGFVHNPHMIFIQYAGYMSGAESPGEFLKRHRGPCPTSKE